MRETPERWRKAAERHMIDLGGLPPRHARRAVLKTLQTMRQALQCFRGVQERLGERVWLDPAGGDQRQQLYLRDADHSEWLQVQPFLEHVWNSGLGRANLGVIRTGRDEDFIPADAPEDWKPGDPHWDPDDFRLDIAPRGDDMRGGILRMTESEAYLEIRYDDSGQIVETCQAGGDAFSGGYFAGTHPHLWDPSVKPAQLKPIRVLLRSDLDVRGWPIERLVEALCESPSEVPGQVRLPVPIPGGVGRAWSCGLRGMRRALFEGTVPTTARWLAADGFAGTALGWGATRQEAEAAWQAEVGRVRPKAPEMTHKPASPAEFEKQVAAYQRRLDKATATMLAEETTADDNLRPLRKPGVDAQTGEIVGKDGKVHGISLGEHSVTLHAQSAPLPMPWPLPVPAHVPCAIVPLPESPELPEVWRQAGFDRCVRLVDDLGRVRHGWLRTEAQGWTLVGEHLLAELDVRRLDADLAWRQAMSDADYAQLPIEFRASRAMHKVRIAHYGLRTPTANDPVTLTEVSCAASDTWDSSGLSGSAAWQVTRLRQT